MPVAVSAGAPQNSSTPLPGELPMTTSTSRRTTGAAGGLLLNAALAAALALGHGGCATDRRAPERAGPGDSVGGSPAARIEAEARSDAAAVAKQSGRSGGGASSVA